jgi:hypothetical protein
VVKVAITIDGAPTSSKGIWKLIFKSTFYMLLELVGAQQTNDVSSQHRHYNCAAPNYKNKQTNKNK